MFNFVGLIVFLIGLGFVVDMIVKSVEELTRIDENGGNIVAGYKVTFEFNYNGQTKIETLCLNEKPSINKKINSPKVNQNNIVEILSNLNSFNTSE